LSHRVTRLFSSFVYRLGGIGSGVALYLIGEWVMSINVSIGVPPPWLSGTTLGFTLAYFAAAHVRSLRWRGWARTAAFTGTCLWGLAWFGGWSGHGGSGYFESTRMFGHLYNISDFAETPSDIEGVMTGLEWFREGVNGNFGEPRLTQTSDGWSVVVVSPHSGRVCAVYRGPVAAWPATREGVPRCQLPPPWHRLAVFAALLAVSTAVSVTSWRDPTEPSRSSEASSPQAL